MVTAAEAVGTRATPAATVTYEYLAFGAMTAVLVVAPFFVYPVFLMKALCFALFACAFNLLVGYVGLLSFGHAVFLGSAGYAAAYAAKVWGFPPELAILFGTAVAGVLGLGIGALAIRRLGIYFAMTTLALQMLYFFALQAPFTGGEDGIQAVPRGMMLGILDLRNTLTLYFVVLAIFLGGFLLIYRAINSPFGHVLTGIRDHEPRAVSLGYKADHYKLMAFVLSAALSGLAGSTKALVFQLASLTDVHWSMSGEVVLITLLGLPLEEQARRLARQGQSHMLGDLVRVVDGQMGDVPRDGETMGEVVVRGNLVMKGYFQDPDGTAQAFAGGWFHSGDLGVWHPDGYVELRDRKKDIIISGGENISTIEVEQTLARHPAVLECAVVAVPDARWGERPKAFVTLKPDQPATAEELIGFCREHLAHFKCPAAVEFGDLPRTSTGKVQKFVLREKEWAGQEKRIH